MSCGTVEGDHLAATLARKYDAADVANAREAYRLLRGCDLGHRDSRSSCAAQSCMNGLDDCHWCQSGSLVKGLYGFQGSFGGTRTVPQAVGHEDQSPLGEPGYRPPVATDVFAGFGQRQR